METAGTTYRDAMFFSIMIYIQILSNDWVNIKVNVTPGTIWPYWDTVNLCAWHLQGFPKVFNEQADNKY